MAHRPLTLGVLGARFSSATGVLVLIDAEGLIPEPRTPGSSTRNDGSGAGHVVHEMVRHQHAGGATIVRRTPNVAAHVDVGSVGSMAAANQGRSTSTSSQREQRPPADAMVHELRADARRRSGRQSSCRIRRRFRSAAAQSKSLYQYTMQGSDIHELYPAAQKLDATLQRQSAAQRRHERSAESTIRRSRVEIDRAARRDRSASTPPAIETALTNAYSSAAGVDDLHADQRVLGRHGARCRSTSRTVDALEQALRPRRAAARSCR